MTTYSIYAKSNDTTAADAIFLSDRFSWAGFVFTWVWALWNRMWIVGSIALAMMLVAAVLPSQLQFLLSLGASILLGLHGNELLGWSLARRGYSEIGLSNGRSLEEAELRFYADGVRIPTRTPTPTMPSDHDMLGLFGTKS